VPSLRGWNGRSKAFAPASLCAVCEGWGEGRICGICRSRFASARPRCERCAIEVPAGVRTCGACLTDPPPFDSTVAATTYGFPWDRVIGAFKFHGALDLTGALVELMMHAHAIGAATAPTLLLPVPLSRQRLRERGYNQAWELARRLRPRFDCEADPDLLLRIKDTPHQLAAPPERRAANVRGAFAVEPRRRSEVRGRTVTLVDDVMTSAATASEVTRVLRSAGAVRVDVWVVARTPRADAEH
jgi:ComF family protein